jgi:hypothetical protein
LSAYRDALHAHDSWRLAGGRFPPAVIVPSHGDVLHGQGVMDNARALIIKALR